MLSNGCAGANAICKEMDQASLVFDTYCDCITAPVSSVNQLIMFNLK